MPNFLAGLSGLSQGLAGGMQQGREEAMRQQQIDIAKYSHSFQTLSSIMQMSDLYPEMKGPLLKSWTEQNRRMGVPIDPTLGDLLAKGGPEFASDFGNLLNMGPEQLAQAVATNPRLKAAIAKDPLGAIAHLTPLKKMAQDQEALQTTRNILTQGQPSGAFPVLPPPRPPIQPGTGEGGAQAPQAPGEFVSPARVQMTQLQTEMDRINEQYKQLRVEKQVPGVREMLDKEVARMQSTRDRLSMSAFAQELGPRTQAYIAKGLDEGSARNKAAIDMLAAGMKAPPGLEHFAPVPKPEASQSEEQLTRIALFDTDPTKKVQASQILHAMQERKLDIAAKSAGATETAKMEADKAQAVAVIKQSDLVQRLLDGRTAPDDISQSFRQPWVRILAVGEAMKRDPNYNEIQADANKKWYQSPTTQRLIRRTESIVAPGGAADEAIRFAKLVNNPAGTPINKLTGQAKVMFGNSQRALLNLVQGISSEEIQQIMGAQGGGERFLEFTQALNDTNLSVQQYVNNVQEMKYLIYTRQAANVRGTPEQRSWEKMGAKFTAERPFAPAIPTPETPGGANAMDFLKKYNVTPGAP